MISELGRTAYTAVTFSKHGTQIRKTTTYSSVNLKIEYRDNNAIHQLLTSHVHDKRTVGIY
jgi:hypothetical protein